MKSTLKPGIPALSAGWRAFLLPAVILFAGLIAYSNSFNASFHYDDAYIVDRDPSVKNFDLTGMFRESPLRFVGTVSFALNYHFGQKDVFGYHIVNFIIHILTALTLFFLVSMMLRTPRAPALSPATKQWLPATVALLFTVHPVQTQAVTYIVQRYASLAALFYLLSLLFYLQYSLHRPPAGATGKTHLYFLSLAACILAMFTKENAVTLPAAVLMLELFFFSESPREILSRKTRLLPYFMLMIAMVGVFYWKNHFSGTGSAPLLPGAVQIFSPFQYLLTQFTVIPKYIQLLFLPVGQNLDPHIYSTTTLLSYPTFLLFLFLCALLVLSIRLYSRDRLLSFSMLFFFLALIPESSVIPILDLMQEHRLYLPSAGFFLALSASAFKYLPRFAFFRSKPALLPVLTALCVLLLAVATFQRNRVWKDEITLWKDVTLKSPHRSRGHNNLGLAYQAAGRLNEASAEFRRALECKPDNASTWNNLGILYAMRNQPDSARTMFRECLRFDAGYAEAVANLGLLFLRSGETDSAVAYSKKALSMNPHHFQAQYQLALALEAQGEFQAALQAVEAAARLEPGDERVRQKAGELRTVILHPETAASGTLPAAAALINQGVACMNTGKTEEALTLFRKALLADPRSVEAAYGLGNGYLRIGKPDSTVAVLTALLALSPRHLNALSDLGVAYAMKGQRRRAIALFQKALTIDPGFVNAKNNLEKANAESPAFH